MIGLLGTSKPESTCLYRVNKTGGGWVSGPRGEEDGGVHIARDSTHNFHLRLRSRTTLPDFNSLNAKSSV